VEVQPDPDTTAQEGDAEDEVDEAEADGVVGAPVQSGDSAHRTPSSKKMGVASAPPDRLPRSAGSPSVEGLRDGTSLSAASGLLA